ncbi:MAG: flagellar basal-body MS-ring/collar protein FliF [Verrucomicrobiia bacterium]
MNFNASQIFTQFGAVWKQLGVNQRVSLVLATLVVVGGLVGLGLWAARPQYSLLYGRLDEAEAAKVIAALNDTKVPYKTGAGGAIYVPSDKVYTVRMQLAGKGIPRGEGVGFEIFDKPNFGISDFVQRANYVRALQGELARTIAQLDGVESARVMIVMPENRLLADNTRKPTASVFIRTTGAAPIEPSAVNSIRFLVANAVEGLQAKNVTVVDHRGNVLSENTDEDSVVGLSSSQLALRRNLEQYLSKKAESMLEKVLGPGQAVVRVSAEINFDTLTKIEEKYDPEGQVLRTSTINDETTDTIGSGAGGVAGVAANTGAETNLVASAGNKSTTKKKVTNSQYEINKTTSNLIQAAGGIKRVTAAVFIAQRFTGSGTNRVASPRSPEELQKLRKIVQSALGITENNPTGGGEITLEEMPFNDQFETEIGKKIKEDSEFQKWLDLGKTVVYPLLAVGILFMFWRGVKKSAVETIPIGIPVGAIQTKKNGNGNGSKEKVDIEELRQPISEPGIITVDVLNKLIRENPENVSQAIKSWMRRTR